MKHHLYNPHFKFVQDPVPFNRHTDKELLQYCLGATLYMPGKKDVQNMLLNKRIPGLTSMVMCFEDAIAESELAGAEANVVEVLSRVSEAVAGGGALS